MLFRSLYRAHGTPCPRWSDPRVHGVHSGASLVSSLSSIPRQLLEHLYLFVSLVFVVLCCCCVSYSADKRSELRRKRTKAGSREFSLAPRQPSEEVVRALRWAVFAVLPPSSR